METTIVVLAWIGLAAVTLLAAGFLVLGFALLWHYSVLWLANNSGIYQYTCLLLAIRLSCKSTSDAKFLAGRIASELYQLRQDRPDVWREFALRTWDKEAEEAPCAP